METIPALLYLVSAICFIMALRGLSGPETARTGVLYGMAGMAIAIITTFSLKSVNPNIMPILGIALGGAIGAGIAKKVQMTALPQLMAAFHSLVGLAAVFISTAAFYNPLAYGIGSRGAIALTSLVEMSIGVAIGAITFTGSITATVVDVLPNGHLLITGEKQIGVNQNVDVLRFSGTVDPRHVRPGNVVASTQVANARILSRGRGQQAEAQQIGWLSRVFLSVLPF